MHVSSKAALPKTAAHIPYKASAMSVAWGNKGLLADHKDHADECADSETCVQTTARLAVAHADALIAELAKRVDRRAVVFGGGGSGAAGSGWQYVAGRIVSDSVWAVRLAGPFRASAVELPPGRSVRPTLPAKITSPQKQVLMLAE